MEAGDDQRLYFTSTLHSHGWYLNSRWKVQDNRKKELLEEKMCRIGYASWPRDRLFGFKADPDGWLELNLGRIERPVELVLNYKTERFGRVRIELPGRKDYSLDNSRSMVGDNLKSVVEWKTGSIIKPEDENPLIARIHMDCAKLYAFELRSPR